MKRAHRQTITKTTHKDNAAFKIHDNGEDGHGMAINALSTPPSRTTTTIKQEAENLLQTHKNIDDQIDE